MYGEECEFLSIVPTNLENTNQFADPNTEDLLNGNKVENSLGKTGSTSTFLEKARRGLDNIRSQPWSGAAADILQVTGIIIIIFIYKRKYFRLRLSYEVSLEI